MSTSSRQAALARLVWAVALMLAATVVVFLAVRSRQYPHSVHASFQSAVNLGAGDDVDLGGSAVGRVTSVSYDAGRANVTLGIGNGPAWPLRRGATAALRFGTTIGVATRRIDLTQGPPGAPPIPDGGIIPAADTQTPVEWDQVFGTFDSKTRAAEPLAAQRGAETLSGHAADLGRGLAALPSGTGALSGVLSDLASDRARLSSLVPETERVTGTLASHASQISALVLVAQETLTTFASRTQEVQASLAGLPPALAQTQTTLSRLDATASQLRPLLTQLAPGARDLRSLGQKLQPALDGLQVVTPAADQAATAAQAAASPIAALLPTLGRFLGSDTAPVLSPLAPMLGCIVPYAPEIAGFLSNWDSWLDHRDGAPSYGLYHIIEGTSSSPSPPLTTVLAARMPGVIYSRALAPGEAGGAPWELAQCGYTQTLRNPSSDPQNPR